MGDRVDLLGNDGLRAVYDTAGADVINIGHLQQDGTIGAYIKVNEMLRKHFAFFGSTGVGKSSAVAVILRQVLEAKPEPARVPGRPAQRVCAAPSARRRRC